MRFHEVMWPNKYILMTYGLWPMHPNTALAPRLFAHMRFIVALSTLICILVPEVMTVGTHWGDIGILGDFGSLIVSHTQLTLKILYYVWRRRNFRSIYEHLKDFWGVSDDPEERRHYERPAGLAKLATIAFYLMGMSNVLSFEVVALIGWMRNRHEMNESLRHRPLPLELSYRFDTQPTPTYEILFAWQTLASFCIVSALIGYDATMMVFVVHVSGQFKLIGARFRVIGRTIVEQTVAKDEHQLRAEMGKCVAQHRHTIRVAKELSALLSPIVFGQIVTSGLGICLCGYAVIEGDGGAIDIAKFFMLFVSLQMQLLLWCAPAELLIQESTAIAETIYYNVPWFQLSPSLRRDLGFVMMRAQKACHVTALYRVMSISKITEVVNAAGSYMALLRSMKN